MSGTLKVTTLQDGASATANLTFDSNGNTTAGGTLAMASSFLRNRIINGAMVIDQRNAGASVTPTADTYTLDRWFFSLTQASKFSTQQNAGSVTPPAGFTNYLGVTSLSSYSISATDVFYVKQAIEGYNVSDLAWGTASAKTVTLSFWVYSSLTGTFGGAIRRGSGNIYVYPFTYTISSANTWTQISITITPPTSTWNSNTTNGIGLNVIFGLGVGSTYSGTAGSWQASDIYGATGAVSVVGTNGATFYITGVQFEVGTVATPFERRQYGTELMLCQRYYYRTVSQGVSYPLSNSGGVYSTTAARTITTFPVRMRTNPTALEQSGAASDYAVLQTNAAITCSAVPTFNAASLDSAYTDFTIASGGSVGSYAMVRGTVSTAYLGWSAEL